MEDNFSILTLLGKNTVMFKVRITDDNKEEM